ncbi:hypothetical protein ACIQNT_18680 [Streptomyces luteogriseus]|uniref:hypothetical protein n=1 Tax=Streptomyces luteogriseus TaxID=68233 RepID=UPI00380E19E2
MTTHTTAKPREGIRAATAPLRREPPAPHEPGPAEAAPFHPRARGRHRKPRPRKVLLAAGGLAVAAGALSLLRLASGPGTDAGSVEAGPRPDPVTTATDDATHGPGRPAPRRRSPRARGRPPPPRPEPRRPPRPPVRRPRPSPTR